MLDERTELLINRRLDGRLTPDESLELDKLLIRNREARQVLEDYQRNDGLVASALQTVVDLRERPEPATPHGGQGWSRFNRFIGTAAAAIVAIIIFAHPPTGGSPDGDADPHGSRAAGVAAVTPLPVVDVAAPDLINGPRRENNRVVRDVLGVMDPQTQNVYLLEMDRQQTVVVPDTMNF